MKFLAVSLLLLLFVLTFPQVVSSRKNQKYRTVLFPNGVKMKAEVADTPKKRQTGLMFLPHLPEGSGMLFIFEVEAPHRFWTKNCQFPLDIIWLDKKKKIIYIEHNVSPCHADSCPDFGPEGQNALYVMETVGGFAKKKGLVPGMQARF